jgi:S-(hydroxymethyl)glutathione dehydrogenase / alcohol dehydrogenase
MRAAILEAPGSDLVVVDDIEVDDPGPGEVLVRVTHCGVCHSDLHVIEGTIPFPVPAVLGHEAAGLVEQVGPGVHHLAEGDKVILTMRPPCGYCYYCARGQVTLCANSAAVATGVMADGRSGLRRHGQPVFRGLGLGGFGEYVVSPAVGAIKVPVDTPLEVACVIGCALQTGVGAALNTAGIEEGSTVLVCGLGGIGIAIVQGARLAGASLIIGVDPVATRREAALSFGATEVVDPTATDIATAALQATGGIGVDYAFDAVGNARLVEAAIAAIRAGGTAVMVGVSRLDETVQVPALLFTASAKQLMGCFLGSSNAAREFPRLLSLWQAGHLDLESMVTARRPLEQVNEAFADMRAGVGLRTVMNLA